jgi:signal transduction histidine kinase
VQPLQLKPVAVSLAPWLAERAEQLKPQTAARNITLQLDTSVEHAVFDPLQVGRAVDNLLENAIRHAPPEGEVQLNILRSESGALVFRVSDSGPGVSAELRDHLFEPFASGRAEGTGLGLALVREIALAHEGVVRYVPQAAGACFELELPWRKS